MRVALSVVALALVALCSSTAYARSAPATQKRHVKPHTIVAPAAPKARAMELSPAPNAHIDDAYPAISASFAGLIAPASGVQMLLDGTDITAQATFTGTTVSYIPRSGLKHGPHTVSFSCIDGKKKPFAVRWSFVTLLDAPRY